ncbi:MAG: GDSL-type esterase/lipase family protein [Jaaginema sp. PMC 1078.18]|nr:GDSL-type esterase/lipase family protein [Jaaginema sp. PMC 1078.18]
MKRYPYWSVLSLGANGVLLLAIAYLWQRHPQIEAVQNLRVAFPSTELMAQTPGDELLEGGDRLKLNYQQWVMLLSQEAKVAADTQPERLCILLGDSISLWFPGELLPPQENWLNQGISGETSAGLLRRLELLDDTEPTAIFVMIGINDLLKGVKEETILANQKLIVRYLKQQHPNAKIVLQSILPHSGSKATWEGRDRLAQIPNERILQLNTRLWEIADSEGVLFLNLYPLFADETSSLRLDLTSDGLHLNRNGYQLWQTALQVFIQVRVDGEGARQ